MNRNAREKLGLPAIAADENGFTLVEVLAALMIFGIVALATLKLTQKAVSAGKVVTGETEVLQQLRYATASLSEDIASARRFSLSPFRGYADSLHMTVLAKAASGQVPLQVRYYVRNDRAGDVRKFVRASSDFSGHREEDILVTHSGTVQFRYLQQAGQTSRWRNRWLDSDGMPLAVQVLIRGESDKKLSEIIFPIRTHRMALPDDRDS